MKTMNTKKHLSRLTGIVMVLASTFAASCSVGDGGDDFTGPYDWPLTDSALGADVGGGEPGPNDNGNSHAGIVTAGEWCDLQNWTFWSQLMLDSAFADKSDYWNFYTNNRVAVQVVNSSGEPMAAIPVKLLRGGTTVWQTRTDNHGLADCWVGLFQKEGDTDDESLRLSIDGQLMDRVPTVAHWDIVGQKITTNHFILDTPTTTPIPQADIAFIVDATGSMGDEISFLKSDLVDIINKAQAVRPAISMRTAALFYRDEGDEYLTRHSAFTTDLSKTADFVSQQRAEGGNDYPEAVHSALEHMLQDLSWEPQARTHLAFLILDAPAHHEGAVISSLQKSIQLCAEQGIQLIPVAASGVDKNTEFMLRFFAVTTGGTYTFLTNDSGVGLDHIKPTVGDYKVELLNELIIRLISYYTE